MTKNADQLLKEALALDATDRAKLAAQLLASLDDRQANVEEAWAAEIARRAADARSDPGEEQDWRTALDEIQQEVLAR
jgi:putative addiction module component (TIGR02574 family)